MQEYSVIGKSVLNVDALKKVKGMTQYTGDIKLPGMLYGKILRSRYPHARILNIDVSRAKQLKGVRAVVTGRDVPYLPYGIAIRDKHAFAVEKVRYLGDEVAGVAAIDEDIAEEACELIEVEYEELPAVFDLVEAMQESAPLIHEHLNEYEYPSTIHPVPGSNICAHFKLRRGNVNEGFQSADYLFEDEFKTQPLSPAPIESLVCIADVDDLGNITIWSATQSPYETGGLIAESLGISLNKVRVIVPTLGGGFGLKFGIKTELISIAMSQSVGKPVRVALTREEVFTGGTVRLPAVFKVKTGVNKDGTIIARKCTEIYDTGAYAGIGPLITLQGMRPGGGPYKIQNIWVDAYTVYTNNTVGGALRGFGTTQSVWAMESQMDIIAEKLGIDPLELRLRNILEEGSICCVGQIAHGVGLKECLRSLEERGKWSQKKQGKERFSGVGIACFHKPTGTPTSHAAIVKVNADSTVDLLISSVDIGQGSNTVFSQMVAEELGISVEKVRVVSPDTRVTPYTSSTTGSRATFCMGNAVKRAAQNAVEELLKVASLALEVPVEKLEFKDGRVWVKASPHEGIPIDKLPLGSRFTKGAKYNVIGNPIIGKGHFTSAGKEAIADPETGQASKASAFWMYGADLVEVEIIPDTGEVKIKRILAAHNVGKVINPLLLEGQVEGGVTMGIGDALYEEVIWEKGETLNPSFMNYRMPTFPNTPEVIEYVFIEEPHKEGPYGNIGAGEAVMIGMSAAIGNAVYDAIGVRIKELPITREKILSALKKRLK
jgi:carbon-monoxide dehydrogenase large subunit